MWNRPMRTSSLRAEVAGATPCMTSAATRTTAACRRRSPKSTSIKQVGDRQTHRRSASCTGATLCGNDLAVSTDIGICWFHNTLLIIVSFRSYILQSMSRTLASAHTGFPWESCANYFRNYKTVRMLRRTQQLCDAAPPVPYTSFSPLVFPFSSSGWILWCVCVCPCALLRMCGFDAYVWIWLSGIPVSQSCYVYINQSSYYLDWFLFETFIVTQLDIYASTGL